MNSTKMKRKFEVYVRENRSMKVIENYVLKADNVNHLSKILMKKYGSVDNIDWEEIKDGNN